MTDRGSYEADLFRKVADHILAEPYTYDQMTYCEPDKLDCGRVGCIAGWAAVLSPNTESVLVADVAIVNVDGLEYDMDEYARVELGLTKEEANYLFSGAWLPKSLPRDEDGIADRSDFSREEIAEHVAKALYKIADGGSVYDA